MIASLGSDHRDASLTLDPVLQAARGPEEQRCPAQRHQSPPDAKREQNQAKAEIPDSDNNACRRPMLGPGHQQIHRAVTRV